MDFEYYVVIMIAGMSEPPKAKLTQNKTKLKWN